MEKPPRSSIYRFIIMLSGFLCLVSINSNHSIINFTFICMRDDMSDVVETNNGTFKSIYDYGENEKSMILAFVGVGTTAAMVPVNYLYIHYGARLPFFIACLVSSFSTIFIPYTAKAGLGYLLFVRFMQGAAYSADFAAIGMIVSRWAPIKETAIFIGILTTFTPVSSIITNFATGHICHSSLGWKWSFYFHAVAGAILAVAWFLIYSDDPSSDVRVSKQELTKIQKHKSAAHLENTTKIPYRKIFTSPVVLCVWTCAFTELSCLVFVTQYGPLYFSRVLQFNVTETGFWLAVVLVAHLPFRFLVAVISDKTKCMSEMFKIHFFNTLAVGAPGAVLVAFGLVPVEHKYVAIAVLAFLEILLGCNCGGFYKSGTLHTRQFSQIVLSGIQFMKCIALLVGPALYSIFVSNDTNRHQWVHIFGVYCVFMVLATLLSYKILTDRPAPWTEDTEKPTTPEVRYTDVVNKNVF